MTAAECPTPSLTTRPEAPSGVSTSYFGAVAMAMGLIDARQLARALMVQRREDVEGWPHRRLGELLVERGDLNEDQVRRVLDRQAGGGVVVASLRSSFLVGRR